MIFEIIVHKEGMKSLLKTIVIANDLAMGLEVINAQYPVPIFTENDVVFHKKLNSLEEVQGSVATKAAQRTLARNIKKFLAKQLKPNP